jgi:hypothetical protein
MMHYKFLLYASCNVIFILPNSFYDELYRVSFLSLPRAQQLYRIESLHQPGSGVTTAVLRITIPRPSYIEVGTAKNICLEGKLTLF